MWFVFRRSRKRTHVSSLLRERSERKTSVFNQKTMFLGYAHSSTHHLSLITYHLSLITCHLSLITYHLKSWLERKIIVLCGFWAALLPF
ncbi:MAG: hypothetical protein U5L45_26785 [Saprospiraceae bacterium]|nr:hypothetical protein [Saprospiraceae bacterium]